MRVLEDDLFSLPGGSDDEHEAAAEAFVRGRKASKRHGNNSHDVVASLAAYKVRSDMVQEEMAALAELEPRMYENRVTMVSACVFILTKW